MEVASSSSRESVSSKKRRDSLYENYVILEAVTVRKKLEKLRRRQSLESELCECLKGCVYVQVRERERERERGEIVVGMEGEKVLVHIYHAVYNMYVCILYHVWETENV